MQWGAWDDLIIVNNQTSLASRTEQEVYTKFCLLQADQAKKYRKIFPFQNLRQIDLHF